jgi:hypothetical protein
MIWIVLWMLCGVIMLALTAWALDRDEHEDAEAALAAVIVSLLGPIGLFLVVWGTVKRLNQENDR